MIVGVVNSQNELTFRIQVIDSLGGSSGVDTIVDTGFSGALTTPPVMVNVLGLPFDSIGVAVIADGSSQRFDIHLAEIEWDGSIRQVFVHARDGHPLIGMKLLVGFDLRARILDGGSIELEAIP